MSITDNAGDTVTLHKSKIEYVMAYVNEERETILALSMALRKWLEPDDPQDPKDSDDLTAWRLAQILEDRLSSTEFEENIGNVLGVKK